MSKDTGGYAFPTNPTFYGHDCDGMTLRDYIAIKAMQAIITGSMADGTKFANNDSERVSIVAFFVADAMLKARGE